MVTLVFMCYLGQKDIKKNILIVPPLLVSKFISTFFFFVFFILVSRCFAYFIGMVVDGSIFLITYAFYREVKK